MSHSVVFVITKRPDVAVNNEMPMDEARALSVELLDNLVEEPLAPFNENTKVEPYKTRCYCVDSLAHRDAHHKAAEEVGSVEEARSVFWARDDVRALGEEIREF